MPTAQDITDNALAKIGVKRGGIPPSDDETADAIKAMNSILAEWQSGGLTVGGVQAGVAGDETFVPDWAEEALAYQIGVRLAPSFDANLTQGFAIGAQDSMDVVVQRGVTLDESEFPTTMPRGAGNRWFGTNNRVFATDRGFNDLTDERGFSLQTERGCILVPGPTEDCEAT